MDEGQTNGGNSKVTEGYSFKVEPFLVPYAQEPRQEEIVSTMSKGSEGRNLVSHGPRRVHSRPEDRALVKNKGDRVEAKREEDGKDQTNGTEPSEEENPEHVHSPRDREVFS